jgi:hypothetical protein
MPLLAALYSVTAASHRFFRGLDRFAELRVTRSRGSEAAQALGELRSLASRAGRAICSGGTFNFMARSRPGTTYRALAPLGLHTLEPFPPFEGEPISRHHFGLPAIALDLLR